MLAGVIVVVKLWIEYV